MMSRPILVFIGVALSLTFAYGQFARMLGTTYRGNEVCRRWTLWNQCTWFKGNKSEPHSKWHKPYFKQLHQSCLKTPFYKFLRLFEEQIETGLNVLRILLEDEAPCGMCSFQQSCGIGCEKGHFNIVAERRCTESRTPQNHTCTVRAEVAPQSCEDLWMLARDSMGDVGSKVDKFLGDRKMLNCIDGFNSQGRPTCKCCCRPFLPDSKTDTCFKPSESLDEIEADIE